MGSLRYWIIILAALSLFGCERIMGQPNHCLSLQNAQQETKKDVEILLASVRDGHGPAHLGHDLVGIRPRDVPENLSGRVIFIEENTTSELEDRTSRILLFQLDTKPGLTFSVQINKDCLSEVRLH